jgi:hypothetical protein
MCNDKYRQHRQRSNAIEPVKAHLRTIARQKLWTKALDAQTRLLNHLINIQTGQSGTDVPLEAMNQGYNRSNDKLALACDRQAAPQSLVSQFYWMSGRGGGEFENASR